MRAWCAWLVFVACGGYQTPERHTSPRLPATIEHVQAAPCAGQLRSVDSHGFVGPSKPTARWVYAIPRGWVYGLTLADGGGVVATSEAGVFAVDDRGAQRWHHGAVVDPRTAAAIGADAAYTLVVDDGASSLHDADFNRGALLQLDACGGTTWRFHGVPQNGKTPAIGKDGTVYFAGMHRVAERESVFALRADGTTAWSHEVADHGKDSATTPLLVGADGSVAYGTYKGNIVLLDATGTPKWTTAVIPGQVVWNGARGPDGTVYAMYERTLAAIDVTGRVLWKQQLDPGANPAPTFGDDGTLYLGGKLLRALRPDGTRTWQLDLGGPVFAPPVIARDGTLFVASQGRGSGRVHAIAPTGELRWTYFVEAPFALALGDGVLYVAAGTRVYALGQCASDACEDDGTALPAVGEPPPAASHPISNLPPKPPPARAEHHDGYTVYPGCRASTTAVVSTGGEPFAWLDHWGSTGKHAAEREEFRDAAVAVAGAASAHASGFGIACVDRAAFMIMMSSADDVAAAAQRIGEWLVKTGQRGEIDLEVAPVPTLQ